VTKNKTIKGENEIDEIRNARINSTGGVTVNMARIDRWSSDSRPLLTKPLAAVA